MEEECEVFRDTIEDLRLLYIVLRHWSFTCNNKRKGDRNVESRLDRFLVSETIMESGSEIHSSALPTEGLDHWPVE